MSAFYISLGLKMTCYHSCRAVSHFQFTAYQNLISVPLQSFYLFVFGFTLILKTASFFIVPRPSANFSQSEIGNVELDVVLEQGDLLYFPRGFIHQGNCLPDAHSLHITISSYQRNSWGDLLLKVPSVTFIPEIYSFIYLF